MRVGALFAGVGGLEQGLAMVLPDVELAWVSEVDKAACKVLDHRYGVPNLGDITKVDWTNVEPVDVLTGGWPCQPFSLAGKQKGAADERALWPYVADAVRVLRPRLVVLENVPAIASAGELGRAVGDLANLGYDAQWRCVRASDVGAPHQRARIFITAWPNADTERGRLARWSSNPIGRSVNGTAPSGGGGVTLANPRSATIRQLPEDHLRKKPGRIQVTDLSVIVLNDLLSTGGRIDVLSNDGNNDWDE